MATAVKKSQSRFSIREGDEIDFSFGGFRRRKKFLSGEIVSITEKGWKVEAYHNGQEYDVTPEMLGNLKGFTPFSWSLTIGVFLSGGQGNFPAAAIVFVEIFQRHAKAAA